MKTITDICQEMLYEYKKKHGYMDTSGLYFEMGHLTFAKLKTEVSTVCLPFMTRPEVAPLLFGIQIRRPEDDNDSQITLKRLQAANINGKEYIAEFGRVDLLAE